MSSPGKASEQVCVVSPSHCLWRRVQSALAPAGYAAKRAGSAKEFGSVRRQRPYLVCFVDARGPGGTEDARACYRARPAERFVLVLDSWKAGGDLAVSPNGDVFGFLREPFVAAEVAAWSRRAADENRLLQGDRSLEDLLYSRFRLFLQNLGPQAMTSLHDLVSERVERPLLRAVLEWSGGNQTRASEILGIHRNTLRAKIRALGIDVTRLPPTRG